MKNTLVKSVVILVIILGSSYFFSFTLPDILNFTFSPKIYSTLGYILPVWGLSLTIALLLLYFKKKEDKKNMKIKLLERYRVKSIKKKQLLYSFLFLFLSYTLTAISMLLLEKHIPFYKNYTENVDTSILALHSWVLPLMYLGMMAGSIMEELLWRGYLLPIQERTLGKYAWVLNGTFWAISHILIYNPVKIFFPALCYSFIASKYKNTTYTIIIHLVVNTIVFTRYL